MRILVGQTRCVTKSGRTGTPASAAVSLYCLQAARPSLKADYRQLICQAGLRDPGAFQYTGEWASGGGWPSDPGKTVFFSESTVSNAEVIVTAHTASLQQDSCDAHNGPAVQEWRVLRFVTAGSASQQSVAKVSVQPGSGAVAMLTDCLAFEYTKTLAASVAAVVGSNAGLSPAMRPGTGIRTLLVGLGGGSLALYIAAHFPGMCVDVVELDPVVAEAAVQHMGFPDNRPGLTLQVQDAVDYVRAAHEDGAVYDLVLVDAFDGQDQIPAAFTSAGSTFMACLPEMLHPRHGTLIMNIHGGFLPNPLRQMRAKLSGSSFANAGFDPTSNQGAEVLRLAHLYRETLLPNTETQPGTAYVVKAKRQFNVALVVSRGLQLGPDPAQALAAAAKGVGLSASILFDAGRLASNRFWQLM